MDSLSKCDAAWEAKGEKLPPCPSLKRLPKAAQGSGGCVRWKRPEKLASTTQAVGEMWPPSCRSWLQSYARDSSNATCRPTSGTRTWMLSCHSWATARMLSRVPVPPRAQTTQSATAQNAPAATIPATLRRNPGTAAVMEASSSGAAGSAHETIMAIVLTSIPSGQLQRQDLGNKSRHGPSASSSCLSNSPSSRAHRATSTLQMRSPLQPSHNQLT